MEVNKIFAHFGGNGISYLLVDGDIVKSLRLRLICTLKYTVNGASVRTREFNKSTHIQHKTRIFRPWRSRFQRLFVQSLQYFINNVLDQSYPQAID